MIKKDFALLATGSKTVEEFTESFYAKKPILYTTRNIRIEFCDKCNSIFSTCDGCFIHQCLESIYKINPLA